MSEKTVEEIQEKMKKDKFRWVKGPWSKEPDRELFKAHGFQCLINRSPLGFWCGYVGVTPDHPWHGKRYDDVDCSIHGGLTYGDHCQGHICHIPEPGEPEHLYWLGFDCGHAGDLCPSMRTLEKNDPVFQKLGSFHCKDVYRNMDYVKEETKRLAKQAADTKA